MTTLFGFTSRIVKVSEELRFGIKPLLISNCMFIFKSNVNPPLLNIFSGSMFPIISFFIQYLLSHIKQALENKMSILLKSATRKKEIRLN